MHLELNRKFFPFFPKLMPLLLLFEVASIWTSCCSYNETTKAWLTFATRQGQVVVPAANSDLATKVYAIRMHNLCTCRTVRILGSTRLSNQDQLSETEPDETSRVFGVEASLSGQLLP